MKQAKTPSLIVLAVEIIVIVILHAAKIKQTDKGFNKEVSTSVNFQSTSHIRSAVSLAAIR